MLWYCNTVENLCAWKPKKYFMSEKYPQAPVRFQYNPPVLRLIVSFTETRENGILCLTWREGLTSASASLQTLGGGASWATGGRGRESHIPWQPATEHMTMERAESSISPCLIQSPVSPQRNLLL